MLGNHETGVLQPVAELAATCQPVRRPLHTDAVGGRGQTAGRFPATGCRRDERGRPQVPGPAGIGALVLRRTARSGRFSSAAISREAPARHGIVEALAIGMRTALELWSTKRFARPADDGPSRTVRVGSRGRLPWGNRPRPTRPAAASHDQRGLPRTRRPDPPVGPGHGWRRLFGRFGLRQRLVGTLADAPRHGLVDGLVASSLRFSLGVTTTEAEIDRSGATNRRGLPGAARVVLNRVSHQRVGLLFQSLSENPGWTISWQQKRRSRARCHPPIHRIPSDVAKITGFFAAVHEREPSLRSGFSLMLAQLGYSDRLSVPRRLCR